jgi:hypothetical protein
MGTLITKKFKVKNYTIRLKFDLENKTIYWIDCTCPDFCFNKIKSSGNFCDKKYSAKPCKHLINYIKFYEAEGYLMITKKLIEIDKMKFIFNKKCEICGEENSLQVHRIIRGNNGGKYTESNCKVVCKRSHSKVHQHEFIK